MKLKVNHLNRVMCPECEQPMLCNLFVEYEAQLAYKYRHNSAAISWPSSTETGRVTVTTLYCACGFTVSDLKEVEYEHLDVWTEDPDYLRTDWQYEVANGDTNYGYWDWVEAQRESDEA